MPLIGTFNTYQLVHQKIKWNFFCMLWCFPWSSLLTYGLQLLSFFFAILIIIKKMMDRERERHAHVQRGPPLNGSTRSSKCRAPTANGWRSLAHVQWAPEGAHTSRRLLLSLFYARCAPKNISFWHSSYQRRPLHLSLDKARLPHISKHQKKVQE